MAQNHEAGNGSPSPMPHVEGIVHDRGVLGYGGTVLDASRREWAGLSGTVRNTSS